jgi:hypothetical protein
MTTLGHFGGLKLCQEASPAEAVVYWYIRIEIEVTPSVHTLEP